MRAHGKKIHKLAMLLFLVLCFSFGMTEVSAASDTTDVEIPVSCTGSDCTAVLLDADGTELVSKVLKVDESSVIVVPCAGLGSHKFFIRLADTDTSWVTYDKTVYEVTVDLYYGADGSVLYTVEAYLAGAYGDGKPVSIKFKNKTYVMEWDPISITVNKLWVCEGTHPDSVTVGLYRGDVLLQTAILNDGNAWTHVFDGLDDSNQYIIREIDVPDGYQAAVQWTGRTCTVVNTDVKTELLPCMNDPPVKKVVEGDPETDSTFTFMFKANDPSYPMPEGSNGDTKTVTITGSGETEFGIIVFTEVGTYEYTVTERHDGEEHYTYDESVYTVRYEVTQIGNQLVSTRIFEKDGERVDEMTVLTFTNVYELPEDPPGETPPPGIKTGDDSHIAFWSSAWIVSILCLAGAVTLLFLDKRKEKR